MWKGFSNMPQRKGRMDIFLLGELRYKILAVPTESVDLYCLVSENALRYFTVYLLRG